MEYIIFGALVLFFFRNKAGGIASNPDLGGRYEPIDYSPEVYALIQKHGINEPRRISPRYRGQ